MNGSVLKRSFGPSRVTEAASRPHNGKSGVGRGGAGRAVIASAVLALFAGTAAADERVIYDSENFDSLELFDLYLEDPSEIVGRPSLERGAGGLVGRPGNGNFTAHKFADLDTDSWTLKLTLKIPPGARYSNSGIYLVYADPETDVPPVGDATRPAFDEALRLAQERRARFGAGPFELDFFSHELQIIAGTDATVPVENHGAAAFYGVDIGSLPGQQVLPNPYELFFGGTYEITLVNEGLRTQTLVRAVGFQNEPVLVSTFRNLTKEQDPVRGGAPKALLLQAFYNNGRDVQSPVIQRITLDLR